MLDSISNISKKTGLSPGSLVHIGEIQDAESKITVVDYNMEFIEEQIVSSIDDIKINIENESVIWINIEGLKDIKLIEAVGKKFNIHDLVLEDILNTHQRPKFEEYDDYLYIVLKALTLEDKKLNVNYEQISILILKNLVITFKEWEDDVFLPIIQRLNTNKGRLRSSGPDYLAYAIMDAVVDQNFVLLEYFDDIIDEVEEELLGDPSAETLITIQQIKRELIYIRKSISPLRELISAILRSETTLILEKTHIYFRDLYDHSIRIMESVESYRDIVTGLLDIYISSISNKMNEVMKILTIFASIFIPLTFIAGIYGMNFEYMPELHMKWAYPALWVAFVVIIVGLLYYFRKKRWL